MCYFIDNTFRLSIIPQICKTAKIVPLFKSGDTQSFTNCRPISVLTCFAKITFFRKHFVLLKTQYGFQSDKSTSHVILDTLTAGNDNVNNNLYTGLIVLYFKKAFDTVYHPLLLHKLEHCSMRGITYKLVNSFLSNTYQYLAH